MRRATENCKTVVDSGSQIGSECVLELRETFRERNETHMIGHSLVSAVQDSSSVVIHRSISVYCARDRPSGEDFCLHHGGVAFWWGKLQARRSTSLVYGGVGVVVQPNTLFAECSACAADIGGVAGPVIIQQASGFTEPFRRFMRTGEIRLAGVKGDASRVVLDPVVHAAASATVAAASVAAVKQVLDRKVDVDSIPAL